MWRYWRQVCAGSRPILGRISQCHLPTEVFDIDYVTLSEIFLQVLPINTNNFYFHTIQSIMDKMADKKDDFDFPDIEFEEKDLKPEEYTCNATQAFDAVFQCYSMYQ